MKFGEKCVHPDVRWRNIGRYKNECGDTVPVLYDLHGVQEYNSDKHSGWIDTAMSKLYETEQK